LFEGETSKQAAIAYVFLPIRANTTSALLLTLALRFSTRVDTVFNIVLEFSIRAPGKALYKLSLEPTELLATLFIPRASLNVT
jgi:hypothetical protein